jgi:hypothetical protein
VHKLKFKLLLWVIYKEDVYISSVKGRLYLIKYFRNNKKYILSTRIGKGLDVGIYKIPVYKKGSGLRESGGLKGILIT